MSEELRAREVLPERLAGAVSEDAIRHLMIRSPLNRAIYEAIRKHDMTNMSDADDPSWAFPLVDLMSNEPPADIGTGELEMVYLADEIEAAVLASSAAGQRKGWRVEAEAAALSSDRLAAEAGSAAEAEQLRCYAEGIRRAIRLASPSAPEERRDESGISDADLDAAARHGFGDTTADELLAEEHRNGVERLREAALVNLRGHAHDVIEQYGRNKVAVALARSVLAATDKGSN